MGAHIPDMDVTWQAQGRLVIARDGSEDGIEIVLCLLEDELAQQTAQFVAAAPDMLKAGNKLSGAMNDYLRSPTPANLMRVARAQDAWSLAMLKAKPNQLQPRS